MPYHKYNSKTSKPADINAIVGAIKEVTIEKKSLRSVGQAYKIDKSKLSRYISKLTQALDPSTASNEQLVNFVSSLSAQTGGKTIFSAQQEEELMKYILKASAIYYGLSISELRKFAYEFAKKIGIQYPAAWNTNCEASKDWYYAYMHRHKNLSFRTPEQISANRAKSFFAANVNAFFANLGTVIDETVFEPHRIWNVDETGCPTVPTKVVKIITSKGSKRVGQKTSVKRGTNVSIALGISATGQSIPPFYIFPRKNMQKMFMDNTAPGAVGVANESGWMTSQPK